MKKMLSLIVALVMTLMMCASASAATELTYWSMWNATEGQAKVIQEAADAYEAATGVKINIEWKGRDVKNLITAALDAGEKIDFYDTDYALMSESHADYLVDLSTLEGFDAYVAHVMPILISTAKDYAGGVLKVMPYQPYTTGVWYDADMWAAAGLTADDHPETFAELLDVCEKIKATGKNPITLNNVDGPDMMYGYQLGRYIGQEATLDLVKNNNWGECPEALKAAQDMYALYEKGYLSPYAPAQWPEGENEIGFEESCMILQASWVPNEVAQNVGKEVNWGFFPWPTVEGGVDGPEASMVGSQSFGIVAKSENAQAAFDFLQTVVTGDFDQKMAEATKSIPADVANPTWPAAVAAAEPYFKLMTKAYQWNVGIGNNPDTQPIILAALVELFQGKTTPDAFVTTISGLK